MKQWYNDLNLNREGRPFKAGLAFVQASLKDLLLSRQQLNPNEKTFFDSLEFDRRKSSYLLGRIASKKALMNLTGVAIPESIWLDFGVFRFPIVRCGEIHNIQVSISHCNNIGVCIAFPESHPVGIDIEAVDASKMQALEEQVTSNERRILKNATMDNAQGGTIIWTIKESLSKILKTGMMLDYKILELNLLRKENGLWESTFTHFQQYKGISFLSRNYVVSLVLPKKTIADFNPVFEMLHQTE